MCSCLLKILQQEVSNNLVDSNHPTLSRPTHYNPSIHTDGSDYFGLAQELTILPQQTELCTPIIIINDQVVEGLELFSVSLETSDPDHNLNITEANVTIQDDNDGMYISVDRYALVLRIHFVA